MKTNREKFLALVSDFDVKTEEKNSWRIANRQWLRVSQGIGFDILEKLDDLNWTQKDLAEKMGVSPPYINKIVKGSENFTLESLVKLQEILDIPILASYFNKKPTESNTESMGIDVSLGKDTGTYALNPSSTSRKKEDFNKKAKPQIANH